jgi:NAD+ synthase (glutamine-hydrolysing)
VSLGLFDFLRKSKQRGFVVSLSGGIDSGATAALCRSAIDLAAQQLGLDGLKKRLSHIKDIQSLQSTDEVAKHLISCAYQSTKNSSTATLEAAKSVAQEVGASFYSWTVDALVDGYQAIAEKALGQPLTWQRHDVAMQNIQARTRSPAIWMLANLKGALLLATSNRSEAAVGYATMDGDTSGGLSPLAGIDKHFLRQWAQWMQSTGPAGLRALASFGKVLAQPPTAELRPAEQHQSDESDLMPYEILDQIERSFVRDKLSPQQCLDVLKKTRPVAEHQQLLNWVQKFFRLWCQNQWKRERYAPSFHLDDESLDPKTWCRFPILSSGFERELAELKL